MAKIVVCDVCGNFIREGSYKVVDVREEYAEQKVYDMIRSNKDVCNKCYGRLLGWELTDPYSEFSEEEK